MNNNLDLITFKKRMSSIVFGQNKLSDYERIKEADLGNIYFELIQVKEHTALFFRQCSSKTQTWLLPSNMYSVKWKIKDFQAPRSGKFHFSENSTVRTLSSCYLFYFRLLDVVIEQKKLYLVFEYLHTDLKDYIDELKEKKKPMDPLLVKRLLYQLISGTAKIHEKRIVHRDLKPANLLLDKDCKCLTM